MLKRSARDTRRFLGSKIFGLFNFPLCNEAQNTKGWDYSRNLQRVMIGPEGIVRRESGLVKCFLQAKPEGDACITDGSAETAD